MAFSAEQALTLLRKAQANDRLAHAYLITGPVGSGTREVAAGLTGILVGESAEPLKHPDVHIAEPESKSRRISIDQVRDLERELQMRALRGGRKVVIIFDADRLGEQAANAFLKTLEEPPRNSHILLVSNFPELLLETILSRCIEIPLVPGVRRGLTDRLLRLAESLRRYFAGPRPETPQIFGLVREMQALMAEARQTISDETEAAFKAESKRYRDASGVSGDWIDDRVGAPLRVERHQERASRVFFGAENPQSLLRPFAHLGRIAPEKRRRTGDERAIDDREVQ